MDHANASFWDHLDELRSVFIRLLIAVALVAIVAFVSKDFLFRIVLAPSRSDFITFRLMGADEFHLYLMNTQLTEQFMVHVRISLYAGLFLVSPYIVWLLFNFISPGLYARERYLARRIVVSSYSMFFLGALLNYFVIFPLTVRFLGNYQVSADVNNMLTISNYVDTLTSMTILTGTMFELPIICWIAGRAGLINRQMMKRYRRHAIVGILIVAAIITPTTDVATLTIVSLPIWMLYEFSILLVGNKQK